MPKLPVRFVRGLRFRLTLSYVVFFTLLLIAIGLFYRQILQTQIEGRERATLEEEWDAAKGNTSPSRTSSRSGAADPEDADVVAQLKHTYSDRGLQRQRPGVQRRRTQRRHRLRCRRDQARSCAQPQAPGSSRALEQARRTVSDRGRLGAGRRQHKQRYFLAIGRSLAASRRTVSSFTRTYFLFLPVLIALSILLGWVVAGRAIRPLNLGGAGGAEHHRIEPLAADSAARRRATSWII